MDHRSRGDMGFSTQLIRWWKSKLIGGYKNIQGMVEKHSDTEDLLQSDAGSILRDTPLPLSRLSNHYECEDMDGFIRTEAELNSRLNGGHQKRRNSTGTLDRLRRLSPAGNVREGLLVDLTNELKENQSRGGVQPVHLGREQRLRCETLPPGSVCPPTSHGKQLCNTPRECATENANCTHSLYSNGEFLSNQQRGRNCLCNHSNQVNRRQHHLTDSETNERRLYGNLTDFQDSRSPNTTKSPNQCKNEANSNYLNDSNRTNSFHSNYEMNCSPQKTGCHSNKDANNSLYDLENISFHSKYETESSCLPSKNGCLSNHIGEIRSHSNQGVNNGCHSNHDAENGFHGDSDGVDVVDSGAPRANNEQLVADLFTMAEEPKDLTYDLTVKEPAVATDKKKKRKEFALTLYDLEGRGQLNRHDIEGLVNKMLETLQQNKPHHTELQQPGSHQSSDNTKDTTTSSQQRSKAIRINFSISPQSTLSKSSPEGTLEHSRPSGTFNEGMDAVEQTLNEQCHRDVDSRLIDSVYDDEMNEKHNKFIDSLISQRHSISSENLIIPNSPEIGGGRRRTRSSMPSPKDSSVGEHLRRKLMKVAATSGRAELESLKENTSPNVNCGLISSQHHTASNDVGGHTMPAHELAGHNFAFLNDNSSTSNHSSFTETSKTACSNLANSTRLQTTPSTHQTTSPNHQTPSPNHQSPSPNHRNLTANDHSRTSPKTSTSAFQNLLSVSKKSCSTSAGKLSLLTSGSASGKRFSYEKLDDGGYYASFQGMRDGPIEEEDDTVVVDRVSHPPAGGVPLCEPNVYVEHNNTLTGGVGQQQRVRPPCLLPWEQNDSSCPLAKETGSTRRGGEYVSRDCVDGGKVVPPTPGGFSSLNTTAPEVAHHRATVFSQPTTNDSSSPLRSTAHATPRALRNYRNKSSSHSGAAARLRRRHSVCAPPAGGGGTGGLGGLLWPPPGGGVEDREADVSADQSADEEDEDSEFGNLKHFGGVSPLRNNSSDVRWRRRRSSSLLQRQELLQIIRANMEKNKSCFLQPRRKSSFHHHHHHHHHNDLLSNFELQTQMHSCYEPFNPELTTLYTHLSSGGGTSGGQGNEKNIQESLTELLPSSYSGDAYNGQSSTPDSMYTSDTMTNTYRYTTPSEPNIDPYNSYNEEPADFTTNRDPNTSYPREGNTTDYMKDTMAAFPTNCTNDYAREMIVCSGDYSRDSTSCGTDYARNAYVRDASSCGGDYGRETNSCANNYVRETVSGGGEYARDPSVCNGGYANTSGSNYQDYSTAPPCDSDYAKTMDTSCNSNCTNVSEYTRDNTCCASAYNSDRNNVNTLSDGSSDWSQVATPGDVASSPGTGAQGSSDLKSPAILPTVSAAHGEMSQQQTNVQVIETVIG
uniref:Uncharacterized protein n=1 Tax=Cacopsylla melanoneura TaxID=428564 RepID=A0A8D8VHK8_9HEMI